MNVWLVSPYGPIPNEGWRDWRYTLMGKALAARGHTATWWTANFCHHFKAYRSTGESSVEVTTGFDIRLVPTSSYRKNISFARIAFGRISRARCSRWPRRRSPAPM